MKVTVSLLEGKPILVQAWTGR